MKKRKNISRKRKNITRKRKNITRKRGGNYERQNQIKGVKFYEEQLNPTISELEEYIKSHMEYLDITERELLIKKLNNIIKNPEIYNTKLDDYERKVDNILEELIQYRGICSSECKKFNCSIVKDISRIFDRETCKQITQMIEEKGDEEWGNLCNNILSNNNQNNDCKKYLQKFALLQGYILQIKNYYDIIVDFDDKIKNNNDNYTPYFKSLVTSIYTNCKTKWNRFVEDYAKKSKKIK
jgi:hypothetical protein